MHSKLARRVLGAMVSAAVMVSMIPAMALADGGVEAVDAKPASMVRSTDTEPTIVNGIVLSVSGTDSNINPGSSYFGVGASEGGVYTFAIDNSEDAPYAGGIITKIEITTGRNIQGCALSASGNDGWGALAANSVLTWTPTEGADPVNSVSLHMDATSGQWHYFNFSAITVYVHVDMDDFTLSAARDYMYKGESEFQISAVMDPENATYTADDLTWEATPETVATLNDAHQLTATALGTVTVTASYGEGEDAITDSIDIRVYDHVSGASISDTEVDDLYVGYTYGLEAYPTNVEDVRDADWDVTFVSSNEEIATVTTTEVQELGQVYAKEAGEVTITAIITDYSQPLVTDGDEQEYKTYEVDCVFNISAVDTVAMYRLYNPNSGEHFYTADIAERDNLESLGWDYEGIGWIAPAISNTPVYRLYNPNAGEHFYTTDAAERDMLIEAGWNDEDIGWYSDDFETVPVYRQYNPNEFANNHNYTADESEKNHLIDLGWRDEGTGWYAISRALEEA